MKRVLIEADLEGISGIADIGEIGERGSAAWKNACERLMADTNAAIAGAFAGGADEVLVEDGHGGGGNFLKGKLDPRAKEVVFDDGSYDPASLYCLMQVGLHAMAGTMNAFLDHTQSSLTWHDYLINGSRVGELAQAAAYVGAYGVPCVLVTGDEAACLEGRRQFGDIETVSVKRAVGRNRAVCIPPKEAEERIFAAAKNAMGKRGLIRPYQPQLPMELKLVFSRSDYCDAVCRRRSDVERLDARTVRRVVSKICTFGDLLF